MLPWFTNFHFDHFVLVSNSKFLVFIYFLNWFSLVNFWFLGLMFKICRLVLCFFGFMMLLYWLLNFMIWFLLLHFNFWNWKHPAIFGFSKGFFDWWLFFISQTGFLILKCCFDFSNWTFDFSNGISVSEMEFLLSKIGFWFIKWCFWWLKLDFWFSNGVFDVSMGILIFRMVFLISQISFLKFSCGIFDF